MDLYKKKFNEPLFSSDQEDIEAFYFLKKKLCSIGTLKPFGSASRCKAFIRRHDYDIGIITELKNKNLLDKYCMGVIKEWDKLHVRIPLHIILVGDFDSEFRYKKIKDREHIIQFVNKRMRYIAWIRTILEKFVQYQYKRLLKFKEKIFIRTLK